MIPLLELFIVFALDGNFLSRFTLAQVRTCTSFVAFAVQYFLADFLRACVLVCVRVCLRLYLGGREFFQ